MNRGKVIGISFTVLVVVLLAFLWSRDAAPEKHADWHVPPDIVVCEGSDVESVEFAIDWWKERGYEFGTVFYVEDGPCPISIPETIIVDTLPELESNYALGTTYFSFDQDTLEMVGARIVILQQPWPISSRNLSGDPKVDKVMDLVMTHEFGHALGFSHLNQNWHIMAPFIERQGFGDEGLSL